MDLEVIENSLWKSKYININIMTLLLEYLTKHGIEEEYNTFIRENNITYSPRKLEDYIAFLNRINPDNHKKLFLNKLYTINENNPFLEININGKPLNTQKKLNTCIISCYEQIKKEGRSFDYFDTFSPLEPRNIRQLDRKIIKITRSIHQNPKPVFFQQLQFTRREISAILDLLNENEENENNNLNYYLYSLAAILRDYDGHTMVEGDLSDRDFPYYHDYPFISHLKDATESDNFVNDVCAHLDVAPQQPFISDDNIDNLRPSRRFLFTYYLLLHAIVPKGEIIAFQKVMTHKTGDENLAKILTKNIFAFGDKSKKLKKIRKGRTKNNRKKRTSRRR